MVDGKSKEQQILKAAGSVDVEKLPSQAEEGGEKEEGGVKSLLPPRDETAVDLKKVKAVTNGRCHSVIVLRPGVQGGGSSHQVGVGVLGRCCREVLCYQMR